MKNVCVRKAYVLFLRCNPGPSTKDPPGLNKRIETPALHNNVKGPKGLRGIIHVLFN